MDEKGLAAEFATAMDRCLADGAPWPGAVAVSGGGDSTALMLLLADWAARAARPAPVVLTVDHRLQESSGRTARAVARRAASLGLAAQLLVWRAARPAGDVEAAARAARYRLMGDWCVRRGVRGLYVAHSLEDQAETFLLRLARGSGLDGLAAMRSLSPYPLAGYDRLRVVRPLLGFGRAALRDYLRARREGWSEDPMNADSRFARVRLRDAWPALEHAGLSATRIADATVHLARAREALEAATERLLDEASRAAGPRIFLDAHRLAAAEREIGLRALAEVLRRVSGAPYRPRFERLERLYEAACAGTLKSARTLHGCRIGRANRADAVFGAATLVVTREKGRGPDRAEIADGAGIS